MKSFKSYLKEYGVLNPAFAVGGSATGPGMGQYNPSADLNLRAQKKNPRIPRKKGQPAGSKKHSDLYTDENPKGTICLLYTSPSPRDAHESRMPSSA